MSEQGEATVATAAETPAVETVEVETPAVAKTEAKEKAPAHFEDEAGQFKTVCRLFMRKKCAKKACKHVHDKQLCPHFWRTGECKYGEECRKNHFVTIPDPETKAQQEAEAVAASEGKEKKPARKTKEKKSKSDKTQGEEPKGDAAKDGEKKATKKKKSERKHRPNKKNTESFEPMTRPVDLRVTYDLGSKDDKFSTPLTTRDVVLVPNLFSDFKKGELYAKLEQELDECGIPREQLLKMWHGNREIDGTHLIVDDHSSWKAKCPTFDLITDRVKSFFDLSIKATRFNWYKDTSQWKPFHFDAAAVKPEIAAIQNFTVGISFGATRDAAFEHADTKTVVSIPQPDGCVYAFSRDTNVIWRHGILQDAPAREEGRISVIAWGWVDGIVDASSSPAAAAS